MAHSQTTVTLEETGRIVRQIVSGFHPQKVILFGSHAYGEPTPDSDVDLVVMETEGSPMHTAARIAGAVDNPFPLDILVMRPGDLQASFQRKGVFVTEVVTQGIVVYEARDRGMDREG